MSPRLRRINCHWKSDTDKSLEVERFQPKSPTRLIIPTKTNRNTVHYLIDVGIGAVGTGTVGVGTGVVHSENLLPTSSIVNTLLVLHYSSLHLRK